jgi:hypothetical protein
MTEQKGTITGKKVPISLKVAAGYLVLYGLVGLIWPLTGVGPNHPEFQAESFAFKIGAHSREILFALLFVISGIGLFRRKSWARKVALVMIVLVSRSSRL